MPYINPRPENWRAFYPHTPGGLAFLISSAIDEYIRDKRVNFTVLCEVEGVLQCVSKEIYRRITAPYEDEKIKENGDVFHI